MTITTTVRALVAGLMVIFFWAGAVQEVSAQGCSERALRSLPRLYSSNGQATIDFDDMMVLTQRAGPVTVRQWTRYRASGDAITYTIQRARGSALAGLQTGLQADFEDDIPIPSPGPHTVACRLSGRTLYFGTNTWSPRRR